MITLDQKLLDLGVKVNYIIGDSAVIEKTESLEQLKQNLITEVFKNWNEQKITESPILAEYRNLHTQLVGQKGNEFLSSPESLIKYILKNQRFININNVVDCYNLVSVKFQVAIGAHDLDKVEGKLKIAIINGSERFIPLGLGKEIAVPAGAYAFSDDKDILCFLESRQCEKTKITPSTKRFITYIQGNAQTSREYLDQATQDLLNFYQKYCQGNFKIGGNL